MQSYVDRCYDTAGSCGITEGTLYDVYVVAQDFVTPTPNLQTVPTERTLDTSDSTTAFTCTAGIFTSNLKPDIVPVSSSPGLPTSQLYGNWTATRYTLPLSLCGNQNTCQQAWVQVVMLQHDNEPC